MKWIQLIWLHLSVGIWTLYLVIRYGTTSAGKKLDVKLKKERKKQDDLNRKRDTQKIQ